MKTQLNSEKNFEDVNAPETRLPEYYPSENDQNVAKKRQTIVVRNGNVFTPLKLSNIALFYSNQKFVFAIDFSGKKFQTDMNLSEIESMLDHTVFFRANRTTIIHFDAIREFVVVEYGKLVIKLVSNDWSGNTVNVSQYRAPRFKDWVAGL